MLFGVVTEIVHQAEATCYGGFGTLILIPAPRCEAIDCSASVLFKLLHSRLFPLLSLVLSSLAQTPGITQQSKPAPFAEEYPTTISQNPQHKLLTHINRWNSRLISRRQHTRKASTNLPASLAPPAAHLAADPFSETASKESS